MVFEILRHLLATVQTFLDLSMGDVTSYDDCAVEAQACADRILAELLEDFRHRAVEVDLHYVTFASLAIFFGDEFTGVRVEFLDPQTVTIDFGFYIAVGGAADTETYGA